MRADGVVTDAVRIQDGFHVAQHLFARMVLLNVKARVSCVLHAHSCIVCKPVRKKGCASARRREGPEVKSVRNGPEPAKNMISTIRRQCLRKKPSPAKVVDIKGLQSCSTRPRLKIHLQLLGGELNIQR